MSKLLRSRFFIPILALLLIAAGILFLTRFSRGALDSYRAMQYAVENDFEAGDLDVDLVQPWMNLRYVAVAYAVPQSYLFEQLGISMDRQSRRLPVGRLDRRLRRGNERDERSTDERRSDEPGTGEPAADESSGVEKVQAAIRAYRENPVATGLDEERVQRWMNVRYIANSTGIPAEAFFEAAGIPLEGNDYKPLRRLVETTEFQGGEERLTKVLEDVVKQYEERDRDSDKRGDRDGRTDRNREDRNRESRDRDSTDGPDSNDDGEAKP